jgi:hypothetical protein
MIARCILIALASLAAPAAAARRSLSRARRWRPRNDSRYVKFEQQAALAARPRASYCVKHLCVPKT